jgi:hypothetical protein
MVAKAGADYEFYENVGVLIRQRRDRAGYERLVKGRWVPIRTPRSFGKEGSPWKKKNEKQLRAFARKYFIRDFGASGIGAEERRERLIRSAPWRIYDPPLKGGSTRSTLREMFERSREAFAELLTSTDEPVVEELKEQALLGYEHQRERIGTVEQRANFFLGAAGLTTSLVLANAGLLLGANRLESSWRTMAALALMVASVCAIAAGLRALQATMITFVRAPPNGVPRLMKRRNLAKNELLQTYVAALIVGQHRLSVIADWKIARMKEARRWFVIVILAIVVLTGFVLADVFFAG